MVDMHLPAMEMDMTFQLVDMFLPVPSMVDMLTIAPPSNGYGYAFTRTSYGGYASLSYGFAPPQYRYV